MAKKTEKIKAIWGVICASSSIDQQTNNISLYTLLEQLTLTKIEGGDENAPQAVPLQYEYVVLLQRPSAGTRASYPMTARIIGPNGSTVNEMPVLAMFDPTNKRLRIRLQNNMLPIVGPGEYKFEMLMEDEEEPLTSIPLEVIIN